MQPSRELDPSGTHELLRVARVSGDPQGTCSLSPGGRGVTRVANEPVNHNNENQASAQEPNSKFLATHKTRTKLHIATLKQGGTNQIAVRKKNSNENAKTNRPHTPPAF